MTQEMIKAVPFQEAENAIGVIISGLQSVQAMADSNAARQRADEALDEAYLAEEHLKKAKNIMSGNPADEPSIDLLFLKVQEQLHEVREYVANDYSSEEESEKLSDLARAKSLLADAVEIIERADVLAQHRLKGSPQPRIILSTLGEYFTFDDASTTRRYCGVTD